MRLLTAFAVGAFLLDQASKVGVLWGLNLAERGAVEVFPPFLRFQMAWNRGINFGLFANHTEFGRFFFNRRGVWCLDGCFMVGARLQGQAYRQDLCRTFGWRGIGQYC